MSHRHRRESDTAREPLKRPLEDLIHPDYDSGQNDNDKDNDSQGRQDRDGRIPDKGRRAPRARREPEVCYVFVPNEGVDSVVLATYIKRFVDGTATIEPSRHPKNPSRIGLMVGISSSLSKDALKDVLDDTEAWELEMSSPEFRRSPYNYVESDTFANRKRKGPSKASQPTLSGPRTRRDNFETPDRRISDRHRSRDNSNQVPTREIRV